MLQSEKILSEKFVLIIPILVMFFFITRPAQQPTYIHTKKQIKYSKTPLLITPQMMQQPDRYTIQLSEPIVSSTLLFSMYTINGVILFEKRLSLDPTTQRVALDQIFIKNKRLPYSYYYLVIRQESQHTTVNQSDSLLFRDISDTHIPQDSTFSGTVTFADVNNDLFPDIIIGFSDFSIAQLLLNDGSGHFIDESSKRLPPRILSVTDVVVFDVDLDDDLDIFFAAQDTQVTSINKDQLLLNDGEGFFTDVSATHLPELPTFSHKVDWGYINNDSYPDLLITGLVTSSSPSQTPLFILMNDSSGHFIDQSMDYLPASQYGVTDAALVDVNGDSLCDIVLANQEMYVLDEFGQLIIFNPQNAIFIQTKENTFVDETSSRMPLDADPSKLIRTTDINNDGAPELYIINIGLLTDEHHRLYLNDKEGFFEDVTTNRLPQQNITFLNEVIFRDFDANGYDDMYLVNVLPGAPAPDFLNINQNGFFSDASDKLSQRQDFSSSASSEDIEADGDLDIFISNGGGQLGSKMPDILLENLSVVVGVKNSENKLTTHFTLFQNYPNPFNATTKIQYELPRTSRVNLLIFNLLGEKVKTLVDEIKPMGSFSVIWDGRMENGEIAPSGLYFYRMKTVASEKTRKLLFLE